MHRHLNHNTIKISSLANPFPSPPPEVRDFINQRMLDESHVSLGLSIFLRSVGIANPFDDDNLSQYSGGSRGSRASGSQRGDRNGRPGRNGYYASVANGNDGGHDVMVPPEDSDERQGTLFAGSTSLALTLAGSCVVEAPNAFHKCGIVWGTILFALMAVSTEKVLHMLCICARKTGSNSYGTVARSSCGGYRAHFQTSALEIGVLLFLVVHYLTLLWNVTDLWVESFQVSLSSTVVLVLLMLCMVPLMIPMQFHTLKYAWTVGLLSVLIFTVSVLVLAIQNFYRHGEESTGGAGGGASSDASSGHTKRDIWSVIEGFQSLLICFMASFNVLSIQAALQDPTRERMETIVHQGVTLGASLTYVVGIVGHLCILAHSSSLDATILDAIQYHTSNQDSGGHSFTCLVHRICHSSAVLAIMIAFLLILVPCRYSILELIEAIYAERQCPELSDCQEDCDTCTTRASTVTEQQNRNNALVVVNNGIGAPSENSTLLDSIEENPTYDLLFNPLAKGICTLGILLWAFLGAVAIPLMDSFYTWVGPLLVYVFAYIMPCMYFLGIQRPIRGDAEKKTARIFARIIVFLCISGIVFSVVYIVANLPTSKSNRRLRMWHTIPAGG